jgi:hypothetical protein
MKDWEHLTREVAGWLREQGVKVREGWSGKLRLPLSRPEVVVTVRRCEGQPSALARYLGERFDPETGLWQEFYGRQLTVELGLDVYAPEQAGGEELAAALDGLLGALGAEPPQGIQVEKLTCGQVVWDRDQRCLRQEVTAACAVRLEAVAREGTAFLDFELRGGWNH